MKNSPRLGPVKVPPSTNTRASPIHRTMMNWQQATRSSPGSVMPPLQPINTMMQNGHKSVYTSYPPPYTPNSAQASSPLISRSSGSALQGGLSSPTSNFSTQQMHQQRSRQHRKSFVHQCPAPPTTSSSSAPPICPISGKPPPFVKCVGLSPVSQILHILSRGSILVYLARPFSLPSGLSASVELDGPRLIC